MEAKMRKKGFVLTLDAVFALVVVMIILLTASYYMTKAREPALSKIQVVKRGSDILWQLNYQKVLDTADSAQINNNLTSLLPVNYDMRIYLNFTGSRPNVTVGPAQIRSTVQIGSGKMIFVLSDDKKVQGFYIARYLIWPK